MAYPDHYLLQFGGLLRDDEIWSMNIRMVASQVRTSQDQEDYLVTAKTAIQAWGAASGSYWSAACKLSYVKFNRIDEDGHYQDPNVTHALFFTPVAMSATASTNANQIAMVISWLTDAERGLACRGRVYMPAPSSAPSATTGRWSSLISPANAAAVFLNSLNYGSGTPLGTTDLEAHVVSRGKRLGTSTWGDGISRRITGVRIGDVPDTQRRRRNALVENYAVNTTVVTDQ